MEDKKQPCSPHRCRLRNLPVPEEWIPDFRYEVIRLHDYSSAELLARGDEMSLVMLFNRVQDAADLAEFLRIPPEEMDRIVRDSPEHVLDVFASVIESLCFKIDASAEERIQCVRRVRERKMGYLFENMEKMSLQEERRTAEAERNRADEAAREAETERQERKAIEEKLRLAEERIKELNREASPCGLHL